jgi:4-hydroxy-3-polyprenylbenzoate decarboxylase
MAYFKSLREYITALEGHGKLVRVKEPINKDTELHPLVRLQFRGLPEEDRKAWLFENVYDAKGKRYSIPVIVGALGASPQVYAIGMQCAVADITQPPAKPEV